MDNTWTCPVCDFEAKTEEGRNEHLKQMTDEAHRDLMKEKAKNAGETIKDKAEDTWEDIKKGVS